MYPVDLSGSEWIAGRWLREIYGITSRGGTERSNPDERRARSPPWSSRTFERVFLASSQGVMVAEEQRDSTKLDVISGMHVPGRVRRL